MPDFDSHTQACCPANCGMLRDKLWHFGRSSPKTRFPAPIDPLFRPPRTNTLYSALYSEGWGAPALGMRRPSAAATALGLELRSDSGRWGERTREPGRCLALARGYARPTALLPRAAFRLAPRWRTSLSAVEGRLPAARPRPATGGRGGLLSAPFPPGWKHRLYGRQRRRPLRLGGRVKMRPATGSA